MPVTIRDVAHHLNLSITTVSRALDGYEDVAEETRQLVIRTAHEMGYVPNQAARQLRRRRSDTIGYILPTDTPRFSDPFFAEFVAGLGDEASAHGFDLLVSTAPPGSPAERQAYESWTHGRKVDGMVLNRMHLSDWRVQYLAQVQFPFVTLERSLDPHDYPSVEVNGRRWFRILIDHLVSLGHQRIAYIGASPDLKIQADRFAGYGDGLQAHGLSVGCRPGCRGRSDHRGRLPRRGAIILFVSPANCHCLRGRYDCHGCAARCPRAGSDRRARPGCCRV